MFYLIRQGFAIYKNGVFYTGGQSVDLTDYEYELHKHKFENVAGSIFPITLPQPNNENNSSLNRIDRRSIELDLVLSISDATYQHLINSTGEILAVFLPSSPTLGLKFAIINNSTSTESVLCNQTIIFPGDRYEIIFDGVEWIEL